MDMPKCRLGFATLIIALVSTVVSGQTSSVGGRVADSQGGIVPNADVTLQVSMPAMPGMKMTAPPPRTARAGADGSFSLDQVPPGIYILQVDADGFGRSSQEITVPSKQPFAITLERLEVPGEENAAGPASGTVDAQALLERIRTLEQRIGELESSTVLSEPETRVKRMEIWVDENGNQYDHPVPGARQRITYQRERVYRRQTISEKIEDALKSADERSVALGISAATVTQMARRTKGDLTTGHAYELASADLFFTAGLAQYTMFFADIVGLSGSPPDSEIPSSTLLNSYTARLVRQNELNLREAWVRTEVFSQRLALTAGRLDLTNTFDRNAAANDETSQFISDALVNNPALGLAVNGAGAAAVFDPKNGINLKVGVQQSNPEATNLSQSIYSLAEGGYVARPPGLGEGNYRFWYRWNKGTDTSRAAFGVSLDQKLIPTVTLFGRYGSAEAEFGRDRFYSIGLGFQNGWVFNPLDTWGIGYAQTAPEVGPLQKLAEGYYNLRLTERLRLSFHLQHVLESENGTPIFGYFLPGVRLQARF
jgi:hypothetical protein